MRRDARSILLAAAGLWAFGMSLAPAQASNRCGAWIFEANGGFEGGEAEATPDCKDPPVPVKLICHGNTEEKMLIGLRFEADDLKAPPETAENTFKVRLTFPDTAYTVAARYEDAYPDLAHYINDPASPIIAHLKTSPSVDIQIEGLAGQTRVSLQGAASAIAKALKDCK